MPGQKILIVEDDATLMSVLKYNLTKEGFTTVVSSDGAQAVQTARSEKPDLIILDIMLPVLSGLEVVRILRKDLTTPIILLTARAEEIDKIVGLELGADDYITKPFSLRELLARVRAILRRNEMLSQEKEKTAEFSYQKLHVGDIEIDSSRHIVYKSGSLVELTPKEFDLLLFLARNPGQVFSRDNLLQNVWGYDFAGGTRTVDVHIRWLREKLESNPEEPKHIITLRGVGYKLEE